MSNISEAVTEALETLGDVAGECVTYHRNSDWVRLTAVRGKSLFSVDDGYGVVSKVRSTDWLVSACDLEFSGSAVTPQKGDLIKVTVGNTVETYDVLRPDSGEQVYRLSDLAGTRLRIHSQLKGTAVASS